VTPEEYERWLARHHAKAARILAESARAGLPLRGGDTLADLLENLAAIAEREAGRES